MEMKDVFVLIVDDDEDMLMFINSAMQDLGYKIINAKNGQEALKIIADRDVDAIISDIQMPQLNGEELLEILKRREKLAIPVIMMAAQASVESTVRCMKLGAFDYLDKNKIEEKKIQDVVKNALVDHWGGGRLLLTPACTFHILNSLRD